jgi:hypothetical protein
MQVTTRRHYSKRPARHLQAQHALYTVTRTLIDAKVEKTVESYLKIYTGFHFLAHARNFIFH